MSLRKQAFSGVWWTYAQQFSTQGISFLVSIVLARLLMPAEFGLIGMIGIFIAVGTTLIDSGFTQSIIRSPDLDQEDYSTVFFFNLGCSIVVYAVIYFAAPYIADFYHQPVLKSIVRVYCLSFIIAAFSAVQNTRLTKLLDFKTQMIVALPSLLGGSVIGIALAYYGYGVWSLVWMNLAQTFLNTVQLWRKSGWVPSMSFNMKKFKTHFVFGYKLTISGLLNTIFNNIYQIVIGRYFSTAQVGYFTRANSVTQLPVSTISSALNKVTFPLFAAIQDDHERLKRAYKMIMQMVVFLIAPILIFLGVLAEPTFRFLFTDKWLPAVPYFQILCFTGILYPIHVYNLNVLSVKGRSDLFLKLEIIKKVLIVVTVAVSIRFGIFALLWSQVVVSIVAFYINTYYSGRIINYSSMQQARDIAPAVILAMFSGLAVFGLDYYLKEYQQIDIIRMLLGGIFGGSIYLFGAYIFKFDSLKEIMNILFKK